MLLFHINTIYNHKTTKMSEPLSQTDILMWTLSLKIHLMHQLCMQFQRSSDIQADDIKLVLKFQKVRQR